MFVKVSSLAILHEPIIMTKTDNLEIDDYARIDGFVKLEGGKKLHIGKYVHIASFAHVGIGGGETIIGDYTAISSGGRVVSGTNETDYPSLSASAPKNLQRVGFYKTTVGRFCCIFPNAILLPGLSMGDGAILAAGSVATKNIPPWEIWFGKPARFLKRRDVNAIKIAEQLESSLV